MKMEQLGFKCGLEIHKQLSGKKLFCNCPAINSNKKPDIEVRRRLRAVAGEIGEIDIAAKHEMEKGKEFIYQANSEDVCNVELDEEPPHPINQEALDTALQVALLLNAKIIDEIQVMRKTVIDGSNTSGFQRTALIAIDGCINTSLGTVRIPTICLEEEAAQKIKEDKESITYKLDRLGIPLIEIGTAADIRTPEHAKEVAAKLGMILKSTGRVLTGIGTIRQDVNISIKQGVRTEIKGFQDLRSITKVIENEIKRQLDCINKGEKLREEVRKTEADFTTSFLRPMPGAARMYPETDISPIKITKERLKSIKIPELIEDKINDLIKKYDIDKGLAKELVYNNNFGCYINKFKNIEPKLIAHILINTPKEIKTRFNLDINKLDDKDFEEILTYLNKRIINKEVVIDLLIDKIKGKKIDISKFKTISDKELEEEIKKITEEKKGLSIGAYMGLIMAKYRGKVDGKKVMEILKRYV
jgi:Glu-tRNA(Gln) amidotransferase subunit E-like FAD-binding protein